MREVMFRAWDQTYKFMSHKISVGNVVDQGRNYTAHAMWVEADQVPYETHSQWMHFDENSDVVLMQYTGLKDKDGNDIYEDDIVCIDCYIPYKVVYKDGAFVTESLNPIQAMSWEKTLLYKRVEAGYVVIGNLYENPELLEDN